MYFRPTLRNYSINVLELKLHDVSGVCECGCACVHLVWKNEYVVLILSQLQILAVILIVFSFIYGKRNLSLR